MFKLNDDFVDSYAQRTPPWGPVGEVTYLRTYSRPEDDGKWHLTCRRSIEGMYREQEKHCKLLRLPWSASKAQRSAQEAFDHMWNMRWLPPGRGLWAMGTGIVDKVGAAALMNCGFVTTRDLATDFSGPFTWLMDMSMLGVGVGFDTLGAGAVTIKEPRSNNAVYVVEDSREGWVDLVRGVLDAYVGKATLPREIDFSRIRPAGTPLKTFGGTAAGADPLIELVGAIHEVLNPCVGQKISSVAIVDLMNLIGRCVVAGNIRRSAELAIGQPDDYGFLQMKDPELHPEELRHHRWASNNSVATRVGQDYYELAKQTGANGEPGYIWLDNARAWGRTGDTRYSDPRVMGFNPCVEQPLEAFEMCCLVETFPSRCENLDQYKRVLKFAYLYGKTVTLIPTHNERTNQVILRNRRIGLSQSGIIENFNRVGRREHFRWCEVGYDHIRQLDEQYSNWLCVPKSIKVTTVKPSGTVSLLPGVTPGIHYPHDRFYFRTIRFAADSDLVTRLEGAGYRVEDDVYTPNTKVVYFAVHEPHFDRAKRDVSMWEQFANAAAMQRYWSDNGVSITITFSQEEQGDIAAALAAFEDQLKAVSLLPLEEHGYAQAPYQAITPAEYADYVQALLPVQLTGEHEVTDAYCDGEACLVPALSATRPAGRITMDALVEDLAILATT